MQDPLLSLEDLAARWKIEPLTLNQWRWKRKGPRSTKIGRTVFYRIQDIERFEEQKSKESIPDIETYEEPFIRMNLEKRFKKQRRVK